MRKPSFRKTRKLVRLRGVFIVVIRGRKYWSFGGTWSMR